MHNLKVFITVDNDTGDIWIIFNRRNKYVNWCIYEGIYGSMYIYVLRRKKKKKRNTHKKEVSRMIFLPLFLESPLNSFQFFDTSFVLVHLRAILEKNANTSSQISSSSTSYNFYLTYVYFNNTSRAKISKVFFPLLSTTGF